MRHEQLKHIDAAAGWHHMVCANIRRLPRITVDDSNINHASNLNAILTHLSLVIALVVLLPHVMSAQSTQGFFLNDLQPREAQPPEFNEFIKPTAPPTATIYIDCNDTISTVSHLLFGNNANVFMTQMVDQSALISNLQTLSPHVLRFPGGNLSSVYFWNADPNEPPNDAPDQLEDANGNSIDPGYWYGNNTASWTISIADYYKALAMTGNEAMFTVNYAYARYSTAADPVASAAHLAADWVRYDSGRTRFWEIGNESNGTWQAGFRINTAANHDGQPAIITGALYGAHFKVFADSMRAAAAETGATIYIGAQLLAESPQSWWNDTDRHWNEGVLHEAGNTPDFYIIHSYYTPYQTDSSPDEILSSAGPETKDMMDFVRTAMVNAGNNIKPVALTEWNIFAEGSKQQVSYIAGMHAALVLGELAKNKYGLACRWDLANGWSNGNDHGMFSQGDEPGIPKWNPRPAFYYMYYFQKYIGNYMLQSAVSGGTSVVSYASRFDSGEVGDVIVNKGNTEKVVLVSLKNSGYGSRYYFYTLTAGTDNGNFSLKVYVNGTGPTYNAGGPPHPEDIKALSAPIGNGIVINLPARSVTYLLVETGSDVITATSAVNERTLKIFPNPSSNGFRIQLPSNGFTDLQLVDLMGRNVYEQQLDPNSNAVNIQALPLQGTYYIILSGRFGSRRTKVIIE